MSANTEYTITLIKLGISAALVQSSHPLFSITLQVAGYACQPDFSPDGRFVEH